MLVLIVEYYYLLLYNTSSSFHRIFIGVSSSLMGVSANWLSNISPFRCVGSTLHTVNDMFSEYYACVNPPPIPQSAYLGYEKLHLFGSLGMLLFIPHLALFLE